MRLISRLFLSVFSIVFFAAVTSPIQAKAEIYLAQSQDSLFSFDDVVFEEAPDTLFSFDDVVFEDAPDIAVDGVVDGAELTVSSKGVTENPQSLWGIFIAGIIGGFAAFLMPCIYPMVPLTVSYLRNKVARG